MTTQSTRRSHITTPEQVLQRRRSLGIDGTGNKRSSDTSTCRSFLGAREPTVFPTFTHGKRGLRLVQPWMTLLLVALTKDLTCVRDMALKYRILLVWNFE